MKKKHSECPYCGSSWIKRNVSRQIRQLGIKDNRGVRIQRYRCKTCLGSFTKRDHMRWRYTKAFKIEVTRRHVEQRESYRVIAKSVREESGRRISPTTLNRMVCKIAES